MEAVFHCPSQFYLFSVPTNVSLIFLRNKCENRVFLSFFTSIYTSPFLCLSESNLRLNGHPLYPVPPASSIHHSTTRTCTLPLRGPLNQALHMSDPHLLLLSPLLSTTPSPLPIPCSHSGFCSVAAAAAAPLPSATTQQRGKEWAKDGRKNKEGE